MRLEEVTARIKKIAAIKDDSHVRHVEEDELLADVLRAISLGQCEDFPPEDFPPEDFAAECVRLIDMKLSKWYS